MDNRIIQSKLRRLQGGAPPRVLDLFSGCGGLFLGFHRKGCVSVGGVDNDTLASLSYAINFHQEEDKQKFRLHAASKDITQVRPIPLLKQLVYDSPAEGRHYRRRSAMSGIYTRRASKVARDPAASRSVFT